LCPALLGEFNDAKYKYRHEITRQYMLASSAFIIENPDKAADPISDLQISREPELVRGYIRRRNRPKSCGDV